MPTPRGRLRRHGLARARVLRPARHHTSPVITTSSGSCCPPTGTVIRCARTTRRSASRSRSHTTSSGRSPRRSGRATCREGRDDRAAAAGHGHGGTARSAQRAVRGGSRDARHRARTRRHRPGRDRRQHHGTEHGADAPVDARGAATGAQSRRRGGARMPPGHRLPAHRVREGLRAPHLPAVHPVHGPDGLPVAAVQQPRVLARGRATARHRGAASRPVPARDHVRALPSRQPSALVRHQRASTSARPPRSCTRGATARSCSTSTSW